MPITHKYDYCEIWGPSAYDSTYRFSSNDFIENNMSGAFYEVAADFRIYSVHTPYFLWTSNYALEYLGNSTRIWMAYGTDFAYASGYARMEYIHVWGNKSVQPSFTRTQSDYSITFPSNFKTYWSMKSDNYYF